MNKIVPSFAFLALALVTLASGCASTDNKQDSDSTQMKVADNDGDGIANFVDSCPNEKGLPEFYGCASAQLVEVTQSKLIIHDKVYFATDSADIEERSHALLDAIARVLEVHPEVEHIRVEGHTDNTGDPAYNVDLSQRRAAAVVAYLVSKGTAQERLEAKGMGPNAPIGENDTDEGRAKNRRVEFVFFQPDA